MDLNYVGKAIRWDQKWPFIERQVQLYTVKLEIFATFPLRKYRQKSSTSEKFGFQY